ncbi:hypothetical protein A1O1_05033 [Capronia coronata CBS 617.96]|uniref:Methyltransferase domain-containing protein n=1 Tax=Capronia coronata CBS 617.96 TaxID=1182541 RepID=W9YEL0_9EURO|nr:uncharacterized protein A1O1_05033 [Capronia coronata CBS 617.96]EXJ88105.1 hypothetical protein A1O1_05033 [Capronia coronata CBS 617.96]
MPPSPNEGTDGSKTWSASHLFQDGAAERWHKIHEHLNKNEFRAAITTAFELPPGDTFTYHASASVNLAQVEAALHAGRANGLHAWYIEPVSDSNGDGDRDGDGATDKAHPSLRLVGYPPPSDVQAYISLFDPTKSAANSLKSLAANAKKGSIRASVAEYLLSKRYLDKSINVPKFKLAPPKPQKAAAGTSPSSSSSTNNADGTGSNPNPNPNPSSTSTPTPSPELQGHQNPALDFWAYACHALEYAGPNANTALVKSAHHTLPVYMHHFGCVVPSWEALQIVAKLAAGLQSDYYSRIKSQSKSSSTGGSSPGAPGADTTSGSVLDMGSGNGYWTLMLRRLAANLDVVAVDSGQSRWRTTWIPDTVVADGVQYLRKRAGCPDRVLLLVYPIVGGEFTRKVLNAYTGDVVCVAGTQNGNGYTGFKDMMIDEYMARERPGWEKVCQVPLPSYAGKDDALFAFRRRKDTAKNGGP